MYYTASPFSWSYSWSAVILPFLEQGVVSGQIDYDKPYWDQPGNWEMMKTRLEVYACPSDPHGGDWVEIGSGGGVNDARATSYSGVADTHFHLDTSKTPLTNCCNGMFYANSAVRVGEVSDGTSHTLAVGEITGARGFSAGQPAFFQQFIMTQNMQSTEDGINSWNTVPGGRDDSPTGNPINDTPLNRHYRMFRELGFSSFHPGGCNFLMVDGSVHFIEEQIEQSLLTAMTTRAGGEPDQRLD